ncbi:MAG: CHAT domain-containing protein, partial [Saprospiraceae bacterium]
QEALRMAEKYLPKNSNERNDALFNLSLSFTERGQYKKAITNLEVIYKLELKSKDTERKASTLGTLGYNYLKFGDLGESLRHYNQALELWQDTTGFIRYANEARVYNHIGNCYFETGLIDSSIVAYKKSLKKINHSAVGSGNIQNGIQIQILLDLAEAYLLKEDYTSAISQINQAKKLYDGAYFEHQGLIDELLGRIHLKQDGALAINHFKKSKKLVQEEFRIYKKHYLVAEKDIWIGKAYLANQELDNALIHFHQALNELTNDSLELKVAQNPNLENIFAKNIALEAIAQKAKTQFLIFQKENNPTYLKQANQTFLLATQLIQNLRQEYLGESSKQNLSSNVLPIFENAIEVALHCFEMTQDSFYLNQAFTFSESNKAIILLESINENSAKGFSGIPVELLSEEEYLRIEITFYKKTINELQQQSTYDIRELKRLENNFFAAQKKYNQLISKFETEYPKYFKLKYSTTLATVDDIQTKILRSNQTLIEYFFGEKNIYIFSLTPSKFDIQTIPKEQKIINAILEINQLISHPPTKDKKDFSTFVNQSNFLFEKLLNESVSNKTGDIIIIPDDLLNYLPFGILLSKKPNDLSITNYSVTNLDYLLKSHTLNYSYSSTLLLNNIEKKGRQFSENFIGFAPSFGQSDISQQRSCGQNELSSLHCTDDEIERIKKLVHGKTFHEEEANITNFHKNSNNCKILHLATHACVDDENPLFNKIHLANDYLSNNDLYNLQLNAELTVLSACNTGAGQLAKGEGVMSLSRGFIHAGCPSVVMSLWSVDDCATSDIMFDFYKYLKQNQTKSTALQNAKIDFIKNATKAQQHPYYWAAFVQIGNASAIEFSKNLQYHYSCLIIFSIVIFFGLLIRHYSFK